VHAKTACGGSGGIVLLIFNLDTMKFGKGEWLGSGPLRCI